MVKHIVRKGTFETNSSSSHSLTILTKEKWDDFENTDKYLAAFDGNLYLVDDLIKEMKEDAKKNPSRYENIVDLNDRASCINFLRSDLDRYYTFEEWGEYDVWSDCLESYAESFTTPSGDEMIAVGYYGCDR